MKRDIAKLKNQKFDLLVCGGGIYGAWTAYDAALRGLKVAVVDKGDWACATSSASSKLIHGGLRYLETFDFKLVKKALSERQMLLEAAPHRVWPLRFGIPVYQNNRIGSLRLKIGLTLYDGLAGNLPDHQVHHSLTKPEFLDHFPNLPTTGLRSGFTYFDAQTDDARYVLELIDGAYQAGAICANYCEVTEFIESNGKISAATIKDQVTTNSFTIGMRQAVDTTGRWSQELGQEKNTCQLTKGIHLIMPNVLKDEALLLTAKSDGRVFFMIPWYGMTLIGTTDTPYQGNLDDIPVTQGDIAYLLTEANQVLHKVNWTQRDIIGKFAGIRVLQPSHRDNPSSISRDWVLKQSANGLLSSIGGKLTSARQDATVIVDKVCKELNNPVLCQTFGKKFPWSANNDYQTLLDTSFTKAKQLGIDKECASWLVKRHGNRSHLIYELCESSPQLIRRIRPELPFIMADLVFCAKNEMVFHLCDLLRRRMPLLILAKLSPDEMSNLAQITAKTLGWDAKKTEAEVINLLK